MAYPEQALNAVSDVCLEESRARTSYNCDAIGSHRISPLRCIEDIAQNSPSACKSELQLLGPRRHGETYLVTGAEAKKAQKKRVSINVWKSFAVALPNEKQIATNIGAITASLLPYTASDQFGPDLCAACLPSLSGAHRRGPIPKPKRKRVVPRVAVCVPTMKLAATALVPDEYADDAQVADIVILAYSMTVVHFDLFSKRPCIIDDTKKGLLYRLGEFSPSSFRAS